MANVQSVNLGTFMRGDSAVLDWSLQKQNEDGTTSPMSLKGYQLACTVKASEYDSTTDDSTAVQGANKKIWKVDIDCDDTTQNGGFQPEEGKCRIPLSKNSTWTNPMKLYVDIVLEDKVTHITQTMMNGTLTVQGHPTNRLSTDNEDIF